MIDSDKLSKIRHFALDMDGTIYSGKTLFKDTLPFLNLLKTKGLDYTFFTNNSSKSVSDYIEHLRVMGIDADTSQMHTSTLATFAWLRIHYPSVKRVYILGTDSLIQEFEQAGYQSVDEDPEIVVVGFDTSLRYERLCRAGYWIKEGKPFIATHPDRICPTDLPTLLVDCGAVCAALTSATGREPDQVLGKPHPIMIGAILERHQLEPDQLAVVGDRVYTDIAMAKSAGALGILVLSGETTRETAETAVPPPDMIISGIGELGQLLQA